MEKNKLMMIIIIALLVLLLGTIGVATFVLRGVFMGGTGAEGDPDGAQSPAYTKPLTAEEIVTYTLADAFTTTLKKQTTADGAQQTTHSIRLTMGIGIDNTDSVESTKVFTLLTSQATIIRDIVNTLIRSKTYEELQRDDGVDDLKEELLFALRDKFQSPLLYEIYFGEYTIM